MNAVGDKEIDLGHDESDAYWNALFDGKIDGPELQVDGHGLLGQPEGDEESEDGVKARRVPRPQSPSKREIAEHELTHIPYRDWCIHCRRASGRAGPHVQKSDEEKAEERERTLS